MTPAIHSNEPETVAKVDRIIETRRQFGEWFRDRREAVARLAYTDPARLMQVVESACWEAFKKGAEGR